MIRQSTADDFESIYKVINDASRAYKGAIPEDRWHEPYMTRAELEEQIEDGVKFSCYCDDGVVLGVMGAQDKHDAVLIRHAYVLSTNRRRGIGTELLQELTRNVDKPVLIGTWAAAAWAIDFYRKNGFSVVPEKEKKILLRKYWRIPERQVEASVVLSDRRYEGSKQKLLAGW